MIFNLKGEQTFRNKINPSWSSSIQHIIELRPPFPIVLNSDRFYITFNLKEIINIKSETI